MLKALTPFWIYWGILIAGCILFFYMPLVFFIFLPMLLVIIPVWALIVYQIGKAVQKKSGFEKMTPSNGTAFILALLPIILKIGLSGSFLPYIFLFSGPQKKVSIHRGYCYF